MRTHVIMHSHMHQRLILTTETIYPGCYGALVCQIARNPALVLGSSSSDERGVEY